MKFYVSGPISGYDNRNELAFRNAASHLEAMGHSPLVPHDITPHVHEGDCPTSYAHGLDHSAACHLRGDLLAVLQADAMFMLGNWEASVGARLEHTVAAHCGIPIYYEFGRVPVPGARRG